MLNLSTATVVSIVPNTWGNSTRYGPTKSTEMITNSNSNILMRRPDAAIIWISVDTKRGYGVVSNFCVSGFCEFDDAKPMVFNKPHNSLENR